MNLQNLSWTSILMVLVMASGAPWLVFVEDWTPMHAYGVLMVSNLVVLVAALGGGLLTAGKGKRLEFLQEVVDTIKDAFDQVFSRSGNDR
jgi:hypothetical protein